MYKITPSLNFKEWPDKEYCKNSLLVMYPKDDKVLGGRIHRLDTRLEGLHPGTKWNIIEHKRFDLM